VVRASQTSRRDAPRNRRAAPHKRRAAFPGVDHAAASSLEHAPTAADTCRRPRAWRPSVDHAAAEPRAWRPSVDHAAAEPRACRPIRRAAVRSPREDCGGVTRSSRIRTDAQAIAKDARRTGEATFPAGREGPQVSRESMAGRSDGMGPLARGSAPSSQAVQHGRDAVKPRFARFDVSRVDVAPSGLLSRSGSQAKALRLGLRTSDSDLRLRRRTSESESESESVCTPSVGPDGHRFPSARRFHERRVAACVRARNLSRFAAS
jgi:hypothetical protein